MRNICIGDIVEIKHWWTIGVSTCIGYIDKFYQFVGCMTNSFGRIKIIENYILTFYELKDLDFKVIGNI